MAQGSIDLSVGVNIAVSGIPANYIAMLIGMRGLANYLLTTPESSNLQFLPSVLQFMTKSSRLRKRQKFCTTDGRNIPKYRLLPMTVHLRF